MRIRKITINLKGNKCDTQTFDILTVSEFCEAVGISRSTWHKLKRQGKHLLSSISVVSKEYAGKLSKSGFLKMMKWSYHFGQVCSVSKVYRV